MNLNILLLIPLLTLAALFFARDAVKVRWISFAGMSLQLVASVALLFMYMAERNTGVTTPLLFESIMMWYQSWNIQYHAGVDGIAVAMILLTSVVMVSGILVSWNIQTRVKEFYILLILLGLGAYGFFIANDLFTMFLFFELAVIPKYLLIAIWGSGKKEFNAMKLVLILMFGSSLVLAGILGTYYQTTIVGGNPSWDLLAIGALDIPLQAQQVLFPLLFIGFAVLSAMFPFHTWAPDGHSSAPTAGSMFLAGISMKLGGYGCLRVATYLFPEAAQFYSPWIVVLATIGIFYGAFVTLRQKDIKMMNAYSSVSHCGFVLLGIGMLTQTAMTGAVLQMVSHGVMTALFFGVIGMVYERTHTRMSDELGGLLKVMPFIGTCFILAGLTSLGLPGLSGFVAEMTVFVGAWQVNELFYRVATVLACMSIVVTAVYILRASGFAMMGPVKKDEYLSLPDATWNEKLAALILIIPIVLIGSLPFWLSGMVDTSVGTWMVKLMTQTH
jgi:NADH-quinone oxidoreductase subunit M